MKKLTATICSLLVATGSFVCFSRDYSADNDDFTGFDFFLLFLMIAYIILIIIFLVRWWKMTTDIKQIREHLTTSNPKLTYLVAIGEKEQAQKAALRMLVDILYPIYLDSTCLTKAEKMNNAIMGRLPLITKLGIELPDYVTSGEKFIDHLNSLTERTVSYRDSDSTYYELR